MASAALSINSLLESFGAKPEITTAIIDRNHFSGPGNGYKRKEYTHEYHSYHKPKGKGKRSIALSALTLLAFLFFLHILQTCLQEHMDNMNSTAPTQIIIMQARLQAIKRAQALKRKVDLGANKPFYFNETLTLDKEPRTKINPTPIQDNKYNTVSQIPIKLKIVDRRNKNQYTYLFFYFLLNWELKGCKSKN